MSEEITMICRSPTLEDGKEWPAYIGAFREALNGAREGLLQAAEIYVKAIDEDAERAREFRAALPYIPEGTWTQFELIGRHSVDVRLLFGDGGPHRWRIRQLPYMAQRRILDGESVDLLVAGGDVLKVDVRTVSSEQAAQLFCGDHLRSVSEQKAWLLDKEQKGRLVKGDAVETMPYVISGNKVTFKRNLTMTLRELKDLVQIMAG